MASLSCWRKLSWYAEWPIKSLKLLFSYNSSFSPRLTCMEITSTLWNLSFPQQRYWILTLILLTWRIGWAPNNARRWEMGYNSEFKGLKPPRMWNCIMKWVLLTYLTNTGPSASPRSSCLLDCWTLTIKALLLSEVLGTTHPQTQHHIPQDLKHLPHLFMRF
jgi:hypothetical protein